MHRDLCEVERRLADSTLGDLPRVGVLLPGDLASTLVVEIADRDLLPTWREANEVLTGLDLCPVAVTSWGASTWTEGHLFSRFHYGDGDTSPASVIERSRALTVDDALARFAHDDQWEIDNWDGAIEWQLASTERRVGSVPARTLWTDIPAGDVVELERRLLQWEETIRPTESSETSESLEWFDPRPHDRVALALLPVAASCDAFAFLSFYGAEGNGRHEALARIARDWQERFGAELVANWGTMLQFSVSAAPTALEEAFELAVQQQLVAPCTTILPGETIRDLARHLWRGDRWFLHERP